MALNRYIWAGGVTCISATWTTSLFLPVAIASEGIYTSGGTLNGFDVLTSGWLALIDLQIGWWANLLLVACLFLSVRKKIPGFWTIIVITILMMLCLGDALTWHEVMFDERGKSPIVYFGAGYYLWFATMTAGVALMLLRAALETREQERIVQ